LCSDNIFDTCIFFHAYSGQRCCPCRQVQVCLFVQAGSIYLSISHLCLYLLISGVCLQESSIWSALSLAPSHILYICASTNMQKKCRRYLTSDILILSDIGENIFELKVASEMVSNFNFIPISTDAIPEQSNIRYPKFSFNIVCSCSCSCC
jgi:hypothetical protein